MRHFIIILKLLKRKCETNEDWTLLRIKSPVMVNWTFTGASVSVSRVCQRLFLYMALTTTHVSLYIYIHTYI